MNVGNVGNITWKEIEAYLKKHPMDASVVIPIGPVEEHGPDLPVDADITTALAIAKLIAARHHCLIFPAIPLMICGISKEVTGTYSIEPETLSLIVRDLLMQFVIKGFRNILFFTGHGGYSMKVVRETIMKVRAASEVVFRADILNFEEACPEQNDIVGVDERDIHAGGIETSRMLYLVPGSVSHIPPADYHLNGELSESGISGDPSQASFEKGRQIAEITIGRIIDWLNEPVTA